MAAEFRVLVVPQSPPAVMAKGWRPLLERLARDTGYRFALDVPPSIPAFQALVHKGMADFVYLSPYDLIVSRRGAGYIPLVRSSEGLQGILVVRKDSRAKTLADINGGTIAFPAPNAYAASLYLRALLAADGIQFAADYVRSHPNVYRHVLSGEAIAGGGVNRTLEREVADVRNNLRVLYATPASAGHPFSAHPRVAETVRSAVRKALLALAASEEGRQLLDGAQLNQVVAADYGSDYRPLERLNLERFAVAGEE